MAEESNALVPIEQKVVEFYGDELTAVLIESEGESSVYIPVRPICDDTWPHETGHIWGVRLCQLEPKKQPTHQV